MVRRPGQLQAAAASSEGQATVADLATFMRPEGPALQVITGCEVDNREADAPAYETVRIVGDAEETVRVEHVH